MYIDFHQNRVVSSSKNHAHKRIFKNCKLHKFANTNSNLTKKIIYGMYHRVNDMNSNFQQNRVSMSVKTVHDGLNICKKIVSILIK